MVKSSLKASAIAASVLSALSMAAAVPANAASWDGPNDVHCAMILEQAAPGTKSSRIASYKCSKPGSAAPAVPAAATLLMTWYKARDFTGDSTKIYGKEGGCGNYGVEYVGDAWNDKIRSFRTYGGCTFTLGYEHRTYGGKCWEYPYSNVAYVGPVVSSFWLRNASAGGRRCNN